MFAAARLAAMASLLAFVGAVLLEAGPPTLQPGVYLPASPSMPPALPSATPGRTIVVAQGGGGDTRTIGEAAAIAEDGDTIVVRPPMDPILGDYTEPGLTFRRDVTVRGEPGPQPIRVRITRPAKPQYDDYSHELLVEVADVVIEDLSIAGGDGGHIQLNGGSLTLDRVTLEGVVVQTDRGAGLTVRDSDIVQSVVEAGGASLIEDVNLLEGCVEVGGDGAPATVRRIRVVGGLCGDEGPSAGAGIVVGGDSVAIEDGTFDGAGITVNDGASDVAVIRNRITGADAGIRVVRATGTRIEGNTIDGAVTGIAVADSPAEVVGNVITGGGTGLLVEGAAAVIRDNTITGNDLAISVVGTTPVPTLSGNTLCDNAADLRVVGSGDVSLDDNEVCGGAGPDASGAARSVTGSGPRLNWQPVDTDFELEHPYGNPGPRWVDGRFLATDQDGKLHASGDGVTWSAVDGTAPPRHGRTDLAWGDRRVQAAGESATLSVEGADGTTSSHTFRGPIDAVAVAPAGIVVIENVTREDVVADVLGKDVAEGDWRLVREESIADPTGSMSRADRTAWWIETEAGELVRIVLSEHGFGGLQRDDTHYATLGWFSPDGVEWTPIRSAPLTYQDRIVGTADGFWWSHGDDLPVTLLHSADGLTWIRVGQSQGYEVTPWRDGILLDSEGGYAFATPEGVEPLPLSHEVFGPGGALPGDRAGSLAVGGLGLILFDRDAAVLLFSPDGVAWSIDDVPAAWNEPGWWIGEMAVGPDAALTGRQRCSDAAFDLEGCPEGTPIETELWRATIIEP